MTRPSRGSATKMTGVSEAVVTKHIYKYKKKHISIIKSVLKDIISLINLVYTIYTYAQ